MHEIYKNYWVRVLISIYSWSVIVLVCIVFFFLELALLLVTYPFDPQRYYVGRFFRLSSVFASKCVPFWDYKIYGNIPAKEPTKTVFVANHRSFADSNIVSYIPWEMKYLVKNSMTLVPFVGWSMRLAGDIPLSRGNKDSAATAMKRCAQYLKAGMNIMIFPEGTRTTTGELGQFKDGAFRLAIETQSDIIPVCVAGTENSLKVSSMLFGPSKGRVFVGRPISTKGMSLKDIEKLKDKVRSILVDMYNEIEPLTRI